MKTIQEKEAQHFLNSKINDIREHEHKIINEKEEIDYLNKYTNLDFDLYYALPVEDDVFDIFGAYEESYTHKAFSAGTFFCFLHNESKINWNKYTKNKE